MLKFLQEPFFLIAFGSFRMMGYRVLLLCFAPLSRPGGSTRGVGAQAGVPILAVIRIKDF